MNTSDDSDQKFSATATTRHKARASLSPYTTSRFWAQHPYTLALLNGLSALKRGDYGARLPLDWTGAAGAAAESFNELVGVCEHLNQELVQLRKTAGDTSALLNALSWGDSTGLKEDSGHKGTGSLPTAFPLTTPSSGTSPRMK
jgi:hypothetical protein